VQFAGRFTEEMMVIGRVGVEIRAPLETRSQIIWAKNNFAIGRGHYHCKHEPCWYVVRKGSTASWVGDHSQTTLWQIDKNLKSETGHGTQKPVECMRRPIENNASPGQAVYEPFSGSGTTIIAAEMTGRVCHAIQIAPAYVDVAVKRWQEFTGQQAVLDGDGRSFEKVAAPPTPSVFTVAAQAACTASRILTVTRDYLGIAVAAGDFVFAHPIPIAGRKSAPDARCTNCG